MRLTPHSLLVSKRWLNAVVPILLDSGTTAEVVVRRVRFILSTG